VTSLAQTMDDIEMHAHKETEKDEWGLRKQQRFE
jgi:hypothetical protein